MKRETVLSALMSFAILAAAQPHHFDGKSWWRHIEILAADGMEGRGAGTPGLERAEAYVVDQVKRSGLAPAGTNGYFQPIRFEWRQVAAADSSAALVRDGVVEPLVLGKDAVIASLPNQEANLEAPLVFLGYGLRVPEKGYDDFAGLDLKGKVAVTMDGLPEGITRPLSTHALSQGLRWRQLRDAGIAGWIKIPAADVAWPSLAESWAAGYPYVSGAEFDEAIGGQISMVFSPAQTDRLFQGTGHTAAELFALAKSHKPLPRFELGAALRAKTRMVRKPFESANVVAKLEGSDPKLKNEYVVFSAHIDGLGIGEPVKGDKIYNGALDNASGCAALLDIAAALKKNSMRLRRSVLFVFFTAEESGMEGSKYFTTHPTVDPKSMAANLNLDAVHALVPLKEIRALGLEESDLGEAARRAGASLNLPVDSETALNPDAFTCCSDQRHFILSGIPSLVLKVGFPGELGPVLERFRRNVQHTPFDDLNQPVNLETAAQFEEMVLRTLIDIANAPHRPEWKAGSFYKRYAGR
jgi:hypothetical protein